MVNNFREFPQIPWSGRPGRGNRSIGRATGCERKGRGETEGGRDGGGLRRRESAREQIPLDHWSDLNSIMKVELQTTDSTESTESQIRMMKVQVWMMLSKMRTLPITKKID